MGMNRRHIAEVADLPETQSLGMRRSSGQPAPQCCAWAGCADKGEYRAPKDRTLTDYLMLCLEHVREYNAQWNFHAGLSIETITPRYLCG